MPDAHDAAVEAMAAALDSGGEYRCGVCGERDLYHDANYADAARRALAALVRSEAVRAALDGGLNRVLRPEVTVVPAYLGWNNAERDTANVRLYATDDGDSPRWDVRRKGGRVVEYALPPQEGDRYLVVRVGNRFTSDEQMQRVTDAILAALAPPETT